MHKDIDRKCAHLKKSSAILNLAEDPLSEKSR